ncbi:MAG: ketoacyl-ACP synthase III [Dehalococcoidia bacterium]|nr:MAG: ketoacyl-ACP synthase III [Dehalococcoidia bacterium]
MARYARVIGWGKYLPDRVLTNQELEQLVSTDDSWISSRTGIRERRIAGADETASTMALNAGKEALEVAGIQADSLDLVIAATCTADHVFPACAALVQDSLGAKTAAAFDVNAACSGFIYALAIGYQFIATGTYDNILVVGTDIYSRILDWQDRNTCVLFGDGAGAVVIQACDSSPGPVSFVLGNDGSGAGTIYTPGPCGVNDGRYFIRMRGPETFRFAVNIVCQATKEVVAASGFKLSDIDLIIPHQANTRIINSAARQLGIPPEKFFMNVDRYGNTSAASIPIALCEAVEEGKVKDGDLLVLVGFGGGLSWAAMVLKWEPGEAAPGA